MSGGFDWQFIVVSLAALWGAFVFLRPLWRLRKARQDAACAHCAAGNPCEPDAARPSPLPPAAARPLVTIGEGRRPAPSSQR